MSQQTTRGFLAVRKLCPKRIYSNPTTTEKFSLIGQASLTIRGTGLCRYSTNQQFGRFLPRTSGHASSWSSTYLRRADANEKRQLSDHMYGVLWGTPECTLLDMIAIAQGAGPARSASHSSLNGQFCTSLMDENAHGLHFMLIATGNTYYGCNFSRSCNLSRRKIAVTTPAH